jgi:hypothetical protein
MRTEWVIRNFRPPNVPGRVDVLGTHHLQGAGRYDSSPFRLTRKRSWSLEKCYDSARSAIEGYFAGLRISMFRRTYRNFDLEATRAREGGYVVRISRKGAVVHELGGDEKGRGAYEDPDIALDWAIDWVEQNFQKARPRFKGGVS